MFAVPVTPYAISPLFLFIYFVEPTQTRPVVPRRNYPKVQPIPHGGREDDDRLRRRRIGSGGEEEEAAAAEEEGGCGGGDGGDGRREVPAGDRPGLRLPWCGGRQRRLYAGLPRPRRRHQQASSLRSQRSPLLVCYLNI